MTFFLKDYLVFAENFEMMMHSEMENSAAKKKPSKNKKEERARTKFLEIKKNFFSK